MKKHSSDLFILSAKNPTIEYWPFSSVPDSFILLIIPLLLISLLKIILSIPKTRMIPRPVLNNLSIPPNFQNILDA